MLDADQITISTDSGTYIKRAVRLMLIARDLQASYCTIETLAARYGVTDRTIYRDLAELQREPIGEPIVAYTVWHSIRLDY